MKNLYVFEVHGKIRVLEAGRFVEKPVYRGDCLKRRGLTQFADLRRGGGLARKRGVMFLSGD